MAAKDSARDALGECAAGAADAKSARASDGNTVDTRADISVAARRNRKPALALAVVQGEARLRRPGRRPGPLLRAMAAADLVETEEWFCDRSNKGMPV